MLVKDQICKKIKDLNRGKGKPELKRRRRLKKERTEFREVKEVKDSKIYLSKTEVEEIARE